MAHGILLSHKKEQISVIQVYALTSNAEEDVRKREPSYTVGRNVNWYSHYGEQYGDPLKNYK